MAAGCLRSASCYQPTGCIYVVAPALQPGTGAGTALGLGRGSVGQCTGAGCVHCQPARRGAGRWGHPDHMITRSLFTSHRLLSSCQTQAGWPPRPHHRRLVGAVCPAACKLLWAWSSMRHVDGAAAVQMQHRQRPLRAQHLRLGVLTGSTAWRPSWDQGRAASSIGDQRTEPSSFDPAGRRCQELGADAGIAGLILNPELRF